MDDSRDTVLKFPVQSRDDGIAATRSASRHDQCVAVSATFTAEPLQRPLAFWMDELEISAQVALAPYGQVMQELLDPQSLLSTNHHGFEVLLIRLEDWIRDRTSSASVAENIEHLDDVSSDLLAGVRALRDRTTTSIFVVLCPSSSTLEHDYQQAIRVVETVLIKRLREIPRVHVWTHDDVSRLYPVERHEDATADRIGHIPYSDEYFIALATFLARHIASRIKPRHKVIAVDCDNTLWKGVCGEDGPEGVELTPVHLNLQQLLVQQHDAGALICLCSKNNPADVDAVFDTRRDMPLRREHLVASRVNWEAKSFNLQSLADELSLSVDSFILIDDSGVEIAEVEAHCPAVLALRFPQETVEASHFLEHSWAFDRPEVTPEARQRTEQYKQNRQRQTALSSSTTLEQFLESLRLQIDIESMQPGHLNRVAELTQRTNQFNFTTVRRRADEIEALVNAGDLRILVVHLRDRFGDYGLVGVVAYRLDAVAIEVDTFLLSCRALGRGVEYRVVNELGRIAQDAGRPLVRLRYSRTARNAPAWKFLEQSILPFLERSVIEDEPGSKALFEITAEQAASVAAQFVDQGVVESEEAGIASKDYTPSSSKGWHATAYRLSRVVDVLAALKSSVAETTGCGAPYVAPRSPAEHAIALAWAEVLGVERVGIEDDFLQLGGDSLRAVRAISAIAAALGREVPLHEFFEAPTVEQLAKKLAAQPLALPAIRPARRWGLGQLSWAQQRVWFIDRLEGGSPAYHVSHALTLLGELEVKSFDAALNSLVRRHESLRTVFDDLDGEPGQRILPELHVALEYVDLRAVEEVRRGHELLELARKVSSAPFNLRTGPLVRCTLVQLSGQEHVLLLTWHHIIFDGWSTGLFTRELGELYAALRERRAHSLPPLPIQYLDYVSWSRQHLSGTALQEDLAYWKAHLAGAPELLELQTDRPRPSVQSHRGACVPMRIPVDLVTQLKAFSRARNVTLATTLYSAWIILLSRLSGQKDIVVGMPVANRRRRELEGLIGFFVNTLALRVRLDDDASAADLLGQVKEAMLGAHAHQDAPFEQVVEALKPSRSLSHSPLFQVMFAFHNQPGGPAEFGGLLAAEQPVPVQTVQFDIDLSLRESASGAIEGQLSYAVDLFDASTIDKWAACFEVLLRSLLSQPQARVRRLPILSVSDRRQLLELVNSTASAYPRARLIHEMFEDQVGRTPNRVAFRYQKQSLTYAELNARANQLAACLNAHGVGPDQLVGICVERSLEMIVGLLGILKAGAAYVPLDPSYPADRLAFVMKDARLRAFLTQSALRHRLPTSDIDVIELDGDWPLVATFTSDNPATRSADSVQGQLAYVIYTSGSTGRPKGVMIEHEHVINLLHGLEDFYGSRGCMRVAWNASINFDASVQQLVQLLAGRSVVLVPQEVRQDAAVLLRFMAENAIHAIDCTPSQLKLWIAAGLLRSECFSSLRVVLVGGEAIDVELWATLSRCQTIDFHNVYGPTECTVDSTSARINADGTAPHIGGPMKNRRIYILDADLEPVPVGVAGEICIGGDGVGRGYLNRPELTEERFREDVFSHRPASKMYRTGDLGRWRADGRIQYLGRNDGQVKIRGFRIELGEIEAQLLACPFVRDAAVVVREDEPGDKRIVAYITAADGKVVTAELLRIHLREALPEYMVPSAFVTLDEMPVSVNGKLERRALPAPAHAAYTTCAYEPPQGRVEEAVAEIWRSLLHLDRVGRRDNFFDVGGHSLIATRVFSRIRERFHVELPLKAIFEAPALHELAERINHQQRQRAEEEAGRAMDLAKGLRAEIDLMDDAAVVARVAELERELGSVGGLRSAGDHARV